MRADRLLHLVALLRAHERLSATELARRLEVTPRTVMRDVEALSAAGVPVYAERGRDGGFSLLPGFRPADGDLHMEETRALFVGGGSGVAAALGMQADFDRALRKLAAGLPEQHAREVGELLERIVIDPGGWGRLSTQRTGRLETVLAGVTNAQRLRIHYRSRGAAKARTRTLDPWGLVLAGSTWYLIAAHRGSPRTYRIDRMEAVVVLEVAATRPARLDLAAVWSELRAAWQDQPTTRVEFRILRTHAELARRSLQLVLVAEPEVRDDGPDHVRLTAQVTSVRGAVGVMLGYGNWVQALDPPELRSMMAAVAREVLEVHQPEIAERGHGLV